MTTTTTTTIAIQNYFVVPSTIVKFEKNLNCIFFDFLPEKTLAQEMGLISGKRNDKPLEENKLLHWIKCILLALIFLHAQKKIHRGIQPWNLWLKDNNIYVPVLGLTKTIKTQNTQEAGSATQYLAPDLELPNYNEKVDLWAIGILMLELMTGVKANMRGVEVKNIIDKLKEKKLYHLDTIKLVAALLSYEGSKRPSASVAKVIVEKIQKKLQQGVTKEEEDDDFTTKEEEEKKTKVVITSPDVFSFEELVKIRFAEFKLTIENFATQGITSTKDLLSIEDRDFITLAGKLGLELCQKSKFTIVMKSLRSSQ